MKYMLIGGPHYQGGKRYMPGDVVESDRALDEVFQGKFELIVEEPEEKAPEATPGKSPVRFQRAAPPSQLDKDEETDEESTRVPKLKAVHKGAGRWVVLNVETGERVNDEYLKKAEAKAMETI